jgi:hypothetical protein
MDPQTPPPDDADWTPMPDGSSDQAPPPEPPEEPERFAEPHEPAAPPEAESLPGEGARGLARGGPAEPEQAADGDWLEPLAAAAGWDQRRSVLDRFAQDFFASVTWRTLVGVAEGALPGLGVGTALNRKAEELQRSGAILTPGTNVRLPFPVWADDSGITLDLSLRRAARSGRGIGFGAAMAPVDSGWSVFGVADKAKPAFVQRHHGVLVVDTLNPRSLHRPLGGPAEPDAEHEPAEAEWGREQEYGQEGQERREEPHQEPGDGAVIVADLAATGSRIVDAGVLWRQACRQLSGVLYDAGSAPARARTRAALRGVRHVGYVDPELGLGLIGYVDAARRPWCLLGFVAAEDSLTGRAEVRFFWP